MGVFSILLFIGFCLFLLKNTLVFGRDLTDTHGKVETVNYYDDHHGIILQADQPVYEFDGYIHVPIKRKIPTFEELMEDISPELRQLEADYATKKMSCAITDAMRDFYNHALERLISMLPDIHDSNGQMGHSGLIKNRQPFTYGTEHKGGIKWRKPTMDFNKPDTKTVTDGKIYDTESGEDESVERKYPYMIKKYNTQKRSLESEENNTLNIYKMQNKDVSQGSVRSKRFAPLVVAGVAGISASLAALFGAVSWNRADISQHNHRLNQLNADIDAIVSHNKELKNGYALLKINQNIIIETVRNDSKVLHLSLNEITCRVDKIEFIQQLMHTWSDTVSNSFFRVLNGLLSEKVPFDLLPGDSAKKMMNDFPDFSKTIYRKIPQLLFTGGSSTLVKLIKNPPTIIAMLSFPRIIDHQIGMHYKVLSCHWKIIQDQIPYYAKLLVEENAIKINLRNTWISSEKCSRTNDYTLCRREDTLTAQKFCFIEDGKFNFSNCPIRFERNIDLYEAHQLPNGVLVCPLTPHYTIFYFEPSGATRVSVVEADKRSHIYCSNNVSSVLVYDKTYTLHHNDFIIDSYVPIHYNHTNVTILGVNDTSYIDFSVHDLKDIKDLSLPEKIPYSYHLVLYTIISGMLLTLMVIVCYWKRKTAQHSKYIGHIYNLTKEKIDTGSLEMNPRDTASSGTQLIRIDG